MQKLALVILLLGFVAKSPAFSAVFLVKAVSSCEKAAVPPATDQEDEQNGHSGKLPLDDDSNEADDVKFPVQSVHFTIDLYPVSALPASLYQAAEVPQLHYAVNTPPPRF